MVVQRGTSTWAAASADTQTQQQTQESIHLMKHNQEYDTDSLRATSVVVTDSNRPSPALRCNVVVPSPVSSIESHGLVEWVCYFSLITTVSNNDHDVFQIVFN